MLKMDLVGSVAIRRRCGGSYFSLIEVILN